MKTRVTQSFISGMLAMLLGASPLYAQESDSTPPTTNGQEIQNQPVELPSMEKEVQDKLASLKESAEQGDLQAMCELWMRYDARQNAEQSSFWGHRYVSSLTKKAEDGDINSMIELGKLYYLGSSLYPKNLETSRSWYAKAAEAGDPAAQLMLAKMLSSGIGGDSNLPKSYEWASKALETYEKRAESGDGQAALWVFLIHEKGLTGQQNSIVAFPFLVKAAELNDLQAQTLLALKYKEGTPQLAQNLTEAVKWFEKAANQKDMGAIMEVGLAYRDGLGVDKDLAKAQSWFEQGSKLGDPYAMTALAKLYIADDSQPENMGKAINLLQKVADIGEIEGSLLLAELYETGKAGEQDSDKAYAILRRMVDTSSNPHPKAIVQLATLCYAKDEEEQGDSLMKRAANMGYVPAIYEVAKGHLNPFSSFTWNPVVSYYYLEAADELGDPDAKLYANLLLYGGVGFIVLICALLVWRFHRFAKRKSAEMDAMEKDKTK